MKTIINEEDKQFFASQSVRTPYGDAKVCNSNHNHANSLVSVSPVGWELANQQKPTFYLHNKDVSPSYPVNSVVHTDFGEGKVLSLRPKEGSPYVIELSNWKLANGKSPLAYISENSLRGLSSSSLASATETTKKTDFFASCIYKALEAKSQAGLKFKIKTLLSPHNMANAVRHGNIGPITIPLYTLKKSHGHIPPFLTAKQMYG